MKICIGTMEGFERRKVWYNLIDDCVEVEGVSCLKIYNVENINIAIDVSKRNLRGFKEV